MNYLKLYIQDIRREEKEYNGDKYVVCDIVAQSGYKFYFIRFTKKQMTNGSIDKVKVYKNKEVLLPVSIINETKEGASKVYTKIYFNDNNEIIEV